MRKVTFGVANSLDNYIARSDDAVDWLLWCDEAQEVTRDLWVNVDAIVMGRKTFDVARQQSKSEEGSGPDGSIVTYVVSRTLTPEKAGPGVVIVDDDPASFVARLKESTGGEIVVMGGGELAHTLLEAGVIDELGVNVHPVLLGTGIPLFHRMEKQIDLELAECRPFSNGCVYMLYRVKS